MAFYLQQPWELQAAPALSPVRVEHVKTDKSVLGVPSEALVQLRSCDFWNVRVNVSSSPFLALGGQEGRWNSADVENMLCYFPVFVPSH